MAAFVVMLSSLLSKAVFLLPDTTANRLSEEHVCTKRVVWLLPDR
jgi:hypothetical protein